MSKNKDIVRQEEFGKDLGLMHEVVITGRKVGMGKEQWMRLAHDESFFIRVSLFIKGALIIEKATGKKLIHTPADFVEKLEAGKIELSKEEIVAICTACGFPTAEINRLLKMTKLFFPLPEDS